MQVPGQVQTGSGEGSGRLWCRCQVRFKKVPENVLEKVPVQRGSREGSGRRWWRSRPGSTRFRKTPEKVPYKVPEKVSEDVGAKPGQVQRGSGRFRRRFRRRFRNALVQRWARFNEGSSRFRCDSGSVLAQLLG